MENFPIRMPSREKDYEFDETEVQRTARRSRHFKQSGQAAEILSCLYLTDELWAGARRDGRFSSIRQPNISLPMLRQTLKYASHIAFVN
jgi:hypothetical protein